MRDQIARLRQDFRRLEAERSSLLVAQVSLVRNLARDLSRHSPEPAEAATALPPLRLVRHARRLVRGMGPGRRRRAEAMATRIEHRLDELLRLAQALVISSYR